MKIFVCLFLIFALIGIAIWRALSRPHAPPRPVPIPGEQWSVTYPDKIDSDGSPWQYRTIPGFTSVVIIREVRDGWVRFHHSKSPPDDSGDGPGDRRERLGDFLQRYSRVDP